MEKYYGVKEASCTSTKIHSNSLPEPLSVVVDPCTDFEVCMFLLLLGIIKIIYFCTSHYLHNINKSYYLSKALYIF